MSLVPIELAPRGTWLNSDPTVRLLATLAAGGPVRVEVVIRRHGRGWALAATGWLADEDPAWPTPLGGGGVQATRPALVGALRDLLAATFHHGGTIQTIRGRPWAVRAMARAAARASERRYRQLSPEARQPPWERPIWLGVDPPREGVRIKTWQSRLRELAGEPERGAAPVPVA